MPGNSFYTDGEYERRNPTWDIAHSPWKARHIHRLLTKNGVQFASACEIGCGAGGVISELSKLYRSTGALFVGYDISPHCIDFVRRMRLCGRYKVFHIPLDLSAQSILRSKPLVERRREVGHVHYFTREIALALLQETGYRILEWSYTDASLSFPRHWRARLLNSVRRLGYHVAPEMTTRALGGWSLLVLAE